MNKNDAEKRKTYVLLRNKITSQMHELILQFTELSKKRPNDIINSFKLDIVNEIIEDSNAIFREGYTPLKNFIKFSEDSMPSNSDVLLVLTQYNKALNNQRNHDSPLQKSLEEMSEDL